MTSPDAIDPAGPTPAELPLSWVQERLWFLEQLRPGIPLGHRAIVARLTGDLDPVAWERSVAALVSRHASLRTRFPDPQGSAPVRPVQVIDPVCGVPLPRVDLSGLPEPLREAAARGVAEAEALRPFDLEAGPLFRALLVRTGRTGHLALLAVHRLVADDRSLEILIRDLAALYTAGGSVERARLPELPIQYADPVLRQRSRLRGEALEGRLRLWRERLAGAPAVLALPLDRPRPPVPSFRGDCRELTCDPALLDGLGALARRSGSTLFLVLLAAFDALLARLTGERDLVVGVPCAHRGRPETEEVVGPFASALPVRVRIDPVAGFTRLVEQVREASRASLVEEDLPFEKLVTELPLQRSLSHPPVFQVLFQLQDPPRTERIELPGLTMHLSDVESRAAELDLSVRFSRSGQGLAGAWRHAADLFDGTTVLRAGRCFEVLLRGILDDPESPVIDVPLLTGAERHQLVVEWSAAADAIPAPPEATLPELFALQAARTPEAVAVVCEGERLTYGELARRVRRAARRLAARGVGPEEVVAVMAGRGPELPIALLAILEAGGVFLPLDPHHPPLRLAHILARSGARWVLTEGHAEAGSGHRPETLGLADLLAEGEGGEDEGEIALVRPLPDHLASLVFAAGSSGLPEGTLLTHRGMLDHLRATIAGLGLRPGDAVAQTTAPGPGLLAWSLGALLVGGRVHVFRDEVCGDPFRLLAAADRERVTVLETAPPLLAGLLRSLRELEPRPALASVRRLISTGAPLAPDLVRACRRELPQVSLHEVAEGTRLHVLDERLCPVPPGAVGELCVAGAGVGRGSLADAAGTAERFVPDPHPGGGPGARLWRTGDLARFRPDGTLERLGRSDETGEIAAALAEHPAVRQCVVLARPQADGTPAFAAWLVTRREADPADLRSFLRHRLPESMIPAAFVPVDALPLTPGGGLDRGALPDPFLTAPEEERERPRNALEELIAGLWSAALGGADCGLHDDFFARGGDSLRGALLVRRLQRRLRTALPVAALFGAPTVARLAAYIAEHHPRAAAPLLGQDPETAVGEPSPGDGLDDATLEAQAAYWRGRLAGLAPALDLPTDRPRPPRWTFQGAAAAGLVPAGLADSLRSLGSRQGVSLFKVLLAAFQLLLQRQSGQDDVAVGAPAGGGLLDPLVLRTDLSGRPTFEELLGRVRETVLGAFAHRGIPFLTLLDELRPATDPSHPPLVQVLFDLRSAPDPLEPAGDPTGFDLALAAAEGEEGLRLRLVWNAVLFDRPRMEELLHQYRFLLEQIAERPGEVVDLYTLVTAEARRLLPDPREALGRRWPGAIHDLLAREAQSHPGRVALSDARGVWTCSELDLAVSRLAARLRADGIRPGDRVAIWAHRSAPLVWAILGVLRAGAAFVILDPAVPDDRLLEILKLTRPHGFLRLEAAGALPPRLDDHVEREPFLSLHQIPAGAAKIAVARFGAIPLPAAWPEIQPGDTAAVSFTAGSSGQPKGIVQTHGAMTHFLPWHREVLGYGEQDRHTLLSGLGHDPLQRDIFHALGTGGALSIPDPARLAEPGYLAAWMRREQVTVTNLTPALAWRLTELPPGSPPLELADLRVAILGGDVLTRGDVARLRRLAPRVLCVNVYGSTESHRALGYHVVEEEGDGGGRSVLPLGRGQRDVQLLVLGKSGGIAGIGELGEIAIRSPHLAEGYLNDPQQTARCFVPNPFTHEPGDRIYLSGDLGRYLPNGEVAAAGRADQRLEIRGIRVDAGEVEAELERIAGVRNAAVLGWDDATGERRLVAWVVLDPAAPPAPDDLRAALRERLPAPLVPSVFLAVEELPLTPNGKLDRRALPDPETVLAERRGGPEGGEPPAAAPPAADGESARLRAETERLRGA